MALEIVLKSFELVHKIHTLVRINNLENKNELNDNILKNYLNVFQICNKYENVYNTWKKSIKPKEEINLDNTVKMIREQSKMMKILNQKLQEKVPIKIGNPRAKIVKDLRVIIDLFNKSVREIIQVKIWKTRLLKRFKCKAFNKNREIWYDIDIKTVYMFYFLYINYLKLYINELNLYILHTRKNENIMISQEKEGEEKEGERNYDIDEYNQKEGETQINNEEIKINNEEIKINNEEIKINNEYEIINEEKEEDRDDKIYKLFKIPKKDKILNTFICKFNKTLFHPKGKLYIFPSFICYYSNIGDAENKVLIKFTSIVEIRNYSKYGIEISNKNKKLSYFYFDSINDKNNCMNILNKSIEKDFVCPICNKKISKDYCVTHINQCALINKF